MNYRVALILAVWKSSCRWFDSASGHH